MNERIGKLAVQAGAQWDYGDWNMPSCVYFGEKDLEKFAQLLITECIKKVELRKEFAIEDEHNVDEAFSLLVYDIEEHFGIEE